MTMIVARFLAGRDVPDRRIDVNELPSFSERLAAYHSVAGVERVLQLDLVLARRGACDGLAGAGS